MSRIGQLVIAALLAVALTADVALAQRGGGGGRGGGNPGGGNPGGGRAGNPGGGGGAQFRGNPGGAGGAQFQGSARANPGGNIQRVPGNIQRQNAVRPGPSFNGNPSINRNTPGVTVRRPEVPNLNRRAPNTTLRNNLDAALGRDGARGRGDFGIDSNRGQFRGNLDGNSRIGRSSPNHPQNWNNWGRNWNQYGVRPAYRNWGYQGPWSGFYGPRWYSGYGGSGFGLNALGLGYGSGFGIGYGSGLFGQGGLGYGLNPWLLNSTGYRWGYNSFTNPYIGNLGGFPYNYAQPVYVTTYVDGETQLATRNDSISEGINAARDWFRAGDYEKALAWIDYVIKASPSDAPAHEFRALTLFALERYEESAATLNALLAVAPGWNWATMAGFYPNVDEYTRQLRGLEAFANEHADSPAPQFLLAYHYLVAGHADAAQRKLASVVELEPRDQVARQLLQGLSKDDEPAPVSAPAEPEERRPASDVMTELDGRFVATRDGGSKFELVLNKSGDFTWKAADEDRDISGEFDLEGNVIVLKGSRGDTLAATVTAEGEDEFHFKLLGAPPEDPGLTFRRADR